MEEQDKSDWGTLAKRLHYSRTAIFNWRKIDGAPQEPDYDAWKLFIQNADVGVAGNRKSKDREALLKEKLETEIQLNKLKIGKEEGRMVEVAEVETRDMHLGTLMKVMLYQRLGRELGPRGVGKDASQLNLLGEQVADEICEIFQRGVENWKTSLTN